MNHHNTPPALALLLFVLLLALHPDGLWDYVVRMWRRFGEWLRSHHDDDWWL